MRLVTWNLWWRFGPWEARQAAIAATLRSVDADIVCVQEVWGQESGTDQAHWLADQLDMFVVRSPQRFFQGVSFGNAVLSRWPIERHHSHRLPPLEGRGRRYAVCAEIRHPDTGDIVPVVTTHLDHRFDHSAVRQRQVTEVLRVVDDLRRRVASSHPVVLAGDLNAVPTSDEIRLITGERPPPVDGLVMSDAWAQVGDGPGVTWDGGNPHVVDSAWPDRRIDYVFVSWPRDRPRGNPVHAELAGLEPVITDDAAEGIVPSDHAAVIVDLHD